MKPSDVNLIRRGGRGGAVMILSLPLNALVMIAGESHSGSKGSLKHRSALENDCRGFFPTTC